MPLVCVVGCEDIIDTYIYTACLLCVQYTVQKIELARKYRRIKSHASRRRKTHVQPINPYLAQKKRINTMFSCYQLWWLSWLEDPLCNQRRRRVTLHDPQRTRPTEQLQRAHQGAKNHQNSIISLLVPIKTHSPWSVVVRDYMWVHVLHPASRFELPTPSQCISSQTSPFSSHRLVTLFFGQQDGRIDTIYTYHG